MRFDDVPWRHIDLNLLVAFTYLYRYQSVSQAAEISCVSQSAMSHSLARLRSLLDDPLFIRKGHRMTPTEYAHSIAPIIARLLDDISQQVLTKTPFAPSDYEGVCRIGLTDYAEAIFAPILFDTIRAQAPKAQVSFINVNRNNYVPLTEQENLDVVIGSFAHMDSEFESSYLYTEKHVCLIDKAFLEQSEALTLEAFTHIEHALVSADGKLTTQVDKTLSELGLSRQVTVATRHFLTLQSLLEQRRLLAIVPKKMAISASQKGVLTHCKPPISVEDFDIVMCWQKRKANEEKSQWLRSVIAEVVC